MDSPTNFEISQKNPSEPSINSPRQDLINFSDFLAFFAFVLIIFGFFFGLLFQGSFFFGFLGISLVLIGCTFLAGFLYVKVKLIESRY